MSLFECPLPEELPFIGGVDCTQKLDQINRLLLIREGADISTLNLESLESKATYEALLSASGIDKGIVTPLLANLVIPVSEGNFTGGNDNSTINGIPYFNGDDNVDVTAELHSVPQAIVKQLQAVTPYSDATRGFIGLRAIFFNKDGLAWVKKAEEGDLELIPLFNFRVSDAGTEGFRAQTMNAVTFTLPSGWSADLVPVKLAFDYKTLVNVAPTEEDPD